MTINISLATLKGFAIGRRPVAKSDLKHLVLVILIILPEREQKHE